MASPRILSADRALRLVAEALLSKVNASAQDLAYETHLPQRTLDQALEDLVAAGWTKCTDQRNGTDSIYAICPRNACCVGVDLGGTKVIVAIADVAGTIVGEATEPTDPRGGYHVLQQIHGLTLKLAATSGIDPKSIGSVTVGMPGVIHPKTGGVSLGPNIADLSGLNVPEMLEALFGNSVQVENDANLAVLGEVHGGSAQGCRNAGFLALGTGTGLGLVVNGQLVRGASGAAGEISYLPLGADLTSDAARDVGAFELEVGSVGIVDRYKASSGLHADTVRGIFGLLQGGDRLAAAVLDHVAHQIALSIVALQATLDLEKIVLGGSIGARPEVLERVRQAMPRVFDRPVDIVASAHGSRAGLVGAVASAARNLIDGSFGGEDTSRSGLFTGPGVARAAE